MIVLSDGSSLLRENREGKIIYMDHGGLKPGRGTESLANNLERKLYRFNIIFRVHLLLGRRQPPPVSSARPRPKPRCARPFCPDVEIPAEGRGKRAIPGIGSGRRSLRDVSTWSYPILHRTDSSRTAGSIGFTRLSSTNAGTYFPRRTSGILHHHRHRPTTEWDSLSRLSSDDDPKGNVGVVLIFSVGCRKKKKKKKRKEFFIISHTRECTFF